MNQWVNVNAKEMILFIKILWDNRFVRPTHCDDSLQAYDITISTHQGQLLNCLCSEALSKIACSKSNPKTVYLYTNGWLHAIYR